MTSNLLKFIGVLFSTALIVLSCSGGDMEVNRITYASLAEVPDNAWESFTKKSIFFGHQSVGNNILEGVRAMGTNKVNRSIEIIESAAWETIKSGGLAHAVVGQNMDPTSKIVSFEKFMHEGLGNRVNAAFFKFCYMDINKDTDIEELFEQYRRSLLLLNEKYPKTRFIHVTVPLTIVQTGPKVWIKNIIGRPIGGYADNARRNRYNRLMRETYAGKEPLFDLAAIESTFPDGRLNTYEHDGNTYSALVPDYASDGRHLNQSGSQQVAQALILFLINLI